MMIIKLGMVNAHNKEATTINREVYKNEKFKDSVLLCDSYAAFPCSQWSMGIQLQ